MKITFRGVRGSIAVPGEKTVRTGGNTSCIEVRTDTGELLILDAGTGIFALSQTLFGQLPLTMHLFITHTHWDHIQGLPFLLPTFIPGNTIHIYGAFDPVKNATIQETLGRQWEYIYFPVREAELAANLHFHTLREGQTVTTASASVTGVLMNHPVINLGYRIESNGRSLFFTGDHEPAYNFYAPADPEYASYERLLAQRHAQQLELIRGVDVLIADTSYTSEDLPSKRGWGHGSYGTSLALARDAGVKHLFFTHHEPTRSDDALQTVFEAVKAEHEASGNPFELHLACENASFSW
ncbi:MAG: MBL fold metallo-hydrolase [Magnetococcales bacterium]|nr:MBL fold metallo-hydrolase [Magnetococcales bacterium]